jgi:WhiB family transcriptional regulator, redox-sensing transcriptional regulator
MTAELRTMRAAFTTTGHGTDLSLDSVIRPPEWMIDGLCAQVDPEAFFPEKGGQTKPAKSICNGGCPVKAECLAYALERGERFGIWGGLSERERRKLERAAEVAAPAPSLVAERAPKVRRTAEHGTTGGYQAHYRRGEKPCAPCQQADTQRQRARRQRSGLAPRKAVCGTTSGYQAHRRRQEPACDPCKESTRLYQQQRKARLQGRAA